MIPGVILPRSIWGGILDTNKHPTVLCCSPEPIGLYGFLCSGLIWNCLHINFASSLASEHFCTHEVMRFFFCGGMFCGSRFAQTQRPHLRPKPKSMTCTIWIREPTPNLRNFHRSSIEQWVYEARFAANGHAPKKKQLQILRQSLLLFVVVYLWPLVLISNVI